MENQNNNQCCQFCSKGSDYETRKCKNCECHKPPAPYHTEGEEWVARLGQMTSKAWQEKLWHSEQTFFKDIKDFIRQELDTRGKQEYNRGYEYAKRNR